MLESAIQRKIIVWLEKNGWFVLKIIASNKPGIMDLLILKEGDYIWIEVKQPKKKPTPLQEYQKRKIIEYGGKVICVTSLNEIVSHEITRRLR